MTTSFLGIPVDGDIVKTGRRANQRPLEEFAPLIEAVLNNEIVAEFGWKQYTPYFNDGEPCIFHAGTPWFRTGSEGAGEDDDTDEYMLEIAHHPVLGKSIWNEQERRYEETVQLPEVAATYRDCQALSSAVESGAFDDVLLEAFGDHAEVTVRRDGIKVGFYDHE